MRAYWRELPPNVMTWRARGAHLEALLARYGIAGIALVNDLGWDQGWEISVGFDKMLTAREWWRRERGDEDDRLPTEPQI